MLRKLKELRFAMLMLAAALFGGPALAAAPEQAPPGLQLAALVAQTTDMPAAQIAIAGPQNVYSVEPLGPPAATGEVIARVRTEAVDASWSAEHKFKSWEGHALFDCAGKRVRIVHGATYAEANLKGAAKVDDLGGSWFTPQPAEPAAVLLAAACDRNFAWPLRAAAQMPPAATPGGGPVMKAQIDQPAPTAAAQRAVSVASPLAGDEETARVQKASFTTPALQPVPTPAAPPAESAPRSKLAAVPTSAVAAVKRWADAGESFVSRRASTVRRWFAAREPAPTELRQAAL